MSSSFSPDEEDSAIPSDPDAASPPLDIVPMTEKVTAIVSIATHVAHVDNRDTMCLVDIMKGFVIDHIIAQQLEEDTSDDMPIVQYVMNVCTRNISPFYTKEFQNVSHLYMAPNPHDLDTFREIKQVVASRSTKNMLVVAHLFAKRRGAVAVDKHDMLRALLHTHDSDSFGGDMNAFLKRLHVSREWLIYTLEHKSDPACVGASTSASARTSSDDGEGGVDATPDVWEECCTSLNELARDGRVTPAYGRDEELRLMCEILCKRKKRNPVVLGEAGVGKTQLVEGLAWLIVNNLLPAPLCDLEIVHVDVGSLIAGTKERGEFEERCKDIIDHCKHNDNIVLFIDEMHSVAMTNKTDHGVAMVDMLKPALASGEISCIGATTLYEYRIHIESDPAMERRFSPVMCDEPSKMDTFDIAMMAKDLIETHHNVHFNSHIVQRCVDLADTHIRHRNFPDKVFDILDEVGSKMVLERCNDTRMDNTYPSDAVSMYMIYQDKPMGGATRTNDPHIASAKMVDCTVASIANIPVSMIDMDIRERVGFAGESLRTNVIGQEQAVDDVLRSLRRAVAFLTDRTPMASFLFTGPTGVGKTHVCKLLADSFFHGNMVRIDMSEYMEPHSVTKLLGAPPGYVGYDEQAGYLTEAVRRQPFSLVLLDEVEKAHPDVMNLFLQVLEDGRLTDAKGRTCWFDRCVIVFTSNLGHGRGGGGRLLGFSSSSEREKSPSHSHDDIKQYFRPEFLNRLTYITHFRSLEPVDAINIATLIVQEVEVRGASRGIEIHVSDELIAKVADEGWTPEYGARGIRRKVIELIEDPVATAALRWGGARAFYAGVEGAHPMHTCSTPFPKKKLKIESTLELTTSKQ